MNKSDTIEASLPPSEAVILEISHRTGTDPTELPILNESIDPEALDVLVVNSPSCSVCFAYAGFQVTVQGPDRIDLDR